jgi:choline dehydrogenase-like flavoprotein
MRTTKAPKKLRPAKATAKGAKGNGPVTKTAPNRYIGDSFDSFLDEMGLREEVEALTVQRLRAMFALERERGVPADTLAIEQRIRQQTYEAAKPYAGRSLSPKQPGAICSPLVSVEKTKDRGRILTCTDQTGETTVVFLSGLEASALAAWLGAPRKRPRATPSDEVLLRRALRRGRRAMSEALKAEGGTLSGQELAALLGVSPRIIEERRAAGQLLALEVGRHGERYPAWQVREGKLLPGMEEILALLPQHDPFARVCFFVRGTPWLSGERPLDRLRRGGDLDPLRRAARTYGEHGCP